MATSWISTRQVISLRLPYDHHDQVTCQNWIRQDQLNRQSLIMAAKELIHLVEKIQTRSPDVSSAGRLCGLCWYKKPGPCTRPFPGVLLMTRGGHHASPRHQQSAQPPCPQVWPGMMLLTNVTPARIQRENSPDGALHSELSLNERGRCGPYVSQGVSGWITFLLNRRSPHR